jgi:hypothetical protein
MAIAMPFDAAADLVAGRGTSRVSPVDVALDVLTDTRGARAASSVAVDPRNAEARDYVRECVALADLGEWFAHKLRGATSLAVYQLTGMGAWLDAAKGETELAGTAFTQLASDTSYIKHFNERMRMETLGLLPFHWLEEAPRLAADMPSVDDVATAVAAEHEPPPKGGFPAAISWLDTPRRTGPGLASLTISPMDPNAPTWFVTATLIGAAPQGATVNILYRNFRSDRMDWVSLPAIGSGTTWTCAVPGTGDGGFFAVEIVGGPGEAYRYPDATVEMPYVTLPP